MQYPLCRHAPGEIFAYSGKQTIYARQFLGEAMALAALLPARGPVANLCRNRYRFAVGFAAALLREQITLLPPNETPGIFEQLALDYPDFYCLYDEQAPPVPFPAVPYPTLPLVEKTATACPSIPAAQIAAVLFTSGSTAKPQPHRRSWGTLVESARAAGRRMGIEAYPAASLLSTVPHQHSYGLESIVMLSLQHGLALRAEKPLLPEDVLSLIKETPGPRLLVTTPVHLRALAESEEALPKLDIIVSATAPLAPQLARRAEEKFAAPLYEIYGCSEAGQLAMRRTTQTDVWHCLEGARLRQDEKGTWAGGALVNPETLLNDVIELKSESEFILLGRAADMINIAGKRSSLAHLTYHLNNINGVADGVFMLPEEEGARLTAFAVAPELTAADIIAHLRRHIDPVFLPRPLYLVEALPRNDLGKLPRETLVQLAEKSGKK